MIIEAGYDIRELVVHRLLADNERGVRSLWIVAMNADLQVLFVRRVSGDFDGDVPGYEDEIFEFLKPKHPQIESLVPRYFSIAYVVPGNAGRLEQHFTCDWLERAAEARGLYCLGEQVFDDEYWHSSGPMYSFVDYAIPELPRTKVFRGPHPLGCECPPCADEEARILAARRSRPS